MKRVIKVKAHKRNGKRVSAHSRKVSVVANKLSRKLKPLSKKFEIAGSLRRGVPANDIDIVLIPKNKAQVEKAIKSIGKVKASGQKQLFSSVDGIQVDLFYAGKDDFGAQLMTRTGPAGGNIGNRVIAKEKGLLLNQYGLYKGNKKIAGKTEKEIYEALGKQYKPPNQRR